MTDRRAHWLLRWAALLPIVLVVAYLRVQLGDAHAAASAEATPAVAGGSVSECTFPGQGSGRKRLVLGVVDSLRAETALDPNVMPWLAGHTEHALWGRMQPCLSQLSLLCFRTMFEGSEPLLVTGFHNYTGMNVQAPSLIQRLGARGVRVAAVADQAFIRLYQQSLAAHAMFEERPAGVDRDSFGRQVTFKWLADPSLDVIISHVIDTDATAHRAGVGAPEYVEKFGEADSFLRDVHARLAPNDSMIVLGDHGHSPEGHHSSGIPATTLVVASGPWFPRGQRVDMNMASTYFLAGAVTCETTPPHYTGQQPFDALTWPDSVRAAFRAASPPPQPAAVGFDILLDVPALLVGLFLLALLLGALGGSVSASSLFAASAGLLAAAVVPLTSVLGIATVAVGAVGLRHRSVDRRIAGLSLLALGVGFAGGYFAPQVIVTLQNHVNPLWTVGFWLGLTLVIFAVAPAAARLLKLPRALALGFTAWGVILYGLFLGPYYYGAIRMLPFGLLALALGFFVKTPVSERRSLLVWLAALALPLIPILFPVMKEWQPRWVVLGFVDGRGPFVAAGAALGFFAAAVALTRDWRAWIRPTIALLAFLAIGIATQLAEWTLVAAVLLLVAHTGWMKLAERFADVHPTSHLLVPVGQASFALSLFFVLLGGYRFASVDFRFALALAPVGAGEAYAFAIGLPLCIVKYLGPIFFMLWSGPRADARAAAFVLLKLLVLGAGLLGMQLSGAPSLALFRQLQSQELALAVLVYGVVALAHVGRPPFALPRSSLALPRATT